MKSAYELAMERLEKDAPQTSLSDEQKAAIAEIDKKYRAQIAEREVFLGGKLEEAKATGNLEAAVQIDEELQRDVRTLERKSEEEKDGVREG